MSPNLVFQQVISHHKSRVSPSMSISTLEASMVDSQSMVNGCQWYINTFFHTLKWICTTNIISPQYTAMQHRKWAWTASHPTQRPVQLPSTVPTLPTSSVWGFSDSSVFPSLVRSFSSWMAKDLIWSRCNVEKRKVGAGRRESQSANWWWWWRLLWLRSYSILFPCKNRSVIAFLRM